MSARTSRLEIISVYNVRKDITLIKTSVKTVRKDITIKKNKRELCPEGHHD